jgi:hypothetical protein
MIPLARLAPAVLTVVFVVIQSQSVSGYHPGGGRKRSVRPPNYSSMNMSSQNSNVDTATIPLISTTKEESGCSIENFRAVAGMGNIYRCASTDDLADFLDQNQDLQGPDAFVFEQAGLILDLRSPSERNEENAKFWMTKASMTVVETDESYPERRRQSTDGNRFVMRIDVLSPSRFTKYIDNWFTAAEKAQSLLFKIVDGQKLHELRIECLNGRGLAGLNEAILETGKEDILRGLQAITLHLEANAKDPVIIHCVQGKDR